MSSALASLLAIEQKMKSNQKAATERSLPDAHSIVIDCKIGGPRVGSRRLAREGAPKVRLLRRSVQRDFLQRGIKESNALAVQLHACKMPKELQRVSESSSSYDVLSDGNDMRNTSVNGQNGDRCPTRKRKTDQSCINQKVSDKLKNRRRNQELTAIIPPPQANIEKNKSEAPDAGAKVCSPSKEELRSIRGNYSKHSKKVKTCCKSPDTEITVENTVLGNQTQFLESRPAELIRVLEKQVQHRKADNRVHLEAEGEVQNAQGPKSSETDSAAGFQPGSLKLSQNRKHLISCGMGQHTTTACGKETNSPGAMEKHGAEAKIVLTDTALESAGVLKPIKMFVAGELEGLSVNCGREVNEEAQSQASGISLGCMRTTPFLATCARTNPFERKKFRTRFHRALERWFKRAQEISTIDATSKEQVFETVNSGSPCPYLLYPDWSYFTEEQEYLQSVEAACFLLNALSLDVAEEKDHNEDDLKNNLPSEVNPASVSFASEQMAKIQPIISCHKPFVVNEFNNQLKDTGNIVKIIVPKKAANVISEEENHSRTIKRSKLNVLKSDVDGTLISPTLSEFEISFHEDSAILGNGAPNTQCNKAGKALVLSTAYKSLQEKYVPRKECSKEGKDVQSPCIPLTQNGSSPLRHGHLNAQFNAEIIDQITTHTFFKDYSSLDLENADNLVNADGDALPVFALPDDCSLEHSCDTVWNTDTDSTLSENYRKPPHSYELFNSIKESNETKEICNKNFERKRIARKSPNIVRACEKRSRVKVLNIVRTYEENNPIKVPDIVRAYEEDALVLDVIQDDPELFGSPSKNNDVSQTSGQSAGQKGAARRTLELTNCIEDNLGISEMNSEDCKESKDRVSSTSVHLSEFDTSGEVLDCTTHQLYGFKPESNIPLDDENYYEIDIYMDKSVEGGDVTESGDHPSQDISISKTDEHLHGGENGISVEGRCSDKSILRADKRLSLEPPLSVSPLLGSAIQNDFRFTSNHSVPSTSVHSPSSPQLNSQEQQCITKPSRYLLELAALPSGCCRYYFATVKGCKRNPCRFGHEPKQEDEKLCIEIIQKFMETNNPHLLSRAVRIFIKYYSNFGPGIHCNSQVMNRLLFALLKVQKLQDLFELLSTVVMMKMLPEAEVLLNVFELVASTGSRNLLPKLIDVTCKCVEAGLSFQPDQFKCIVQLLTQLQVSHQEINLILALENRSLFHPAEQSNFNFAIAEIKHYKEKGQWDKIGILYQSLHLNCGGKRDLHRVAKCIAAALIQAKDDGPVVPFCEFAKAVLQKPHTNGLTKHLLGRIGISVMVAYYSIEKWGKARQTLDVLQEIQPNFTGVKALVTEGTVSKCQIVNVAADIFLKTRCVNQAFRMLQGIMDVAQYVSVFSKLLDECIQNNCLGVSLDTVDFMRSANIPINSLAIRKLITALGRCCLWPKARKQYKKALSTGCYPPMEVNLHHRLLPVPYFMSEVEMLLAIEVFLVTNASSIQSPSVPHQPYQIVLRRPEDERSNLNRMSNGEYEAAVDRLMAAARISEPKLQVKHTTVNIAREEVFSLEYCSALKWLDQNMNWAGNAWLFG
uniref:Protein TOPAZ1 n=1 Tax=Callorhinchus milii TaxID=7868 RepID=A0A4W3IUG8_CALMI|eukprot:gi/632965671/ref/XP_007899008.1/ PREDICTED: testis- and ovary-specific PAZ domain-containing protein 1 isoform X3 [Callorhinchus milii]